MRWAMALLMLGHGVIHSIGVAKGFGWAELSRLTTPLSPRAGLLWLAAGLAMAGTAALYVVSPRSWWIVGIPAVFLSQVAISLAWQDAAAGTVPNLVILTAALFGFAADGPFGLRAEYERLVLAGFDPTESSVTVSAAGLDGLPVPVRRYMEWAGAAGQPGVDHFRAKWRGRIRAGPDDPWMEFEAEQFNEVDPPRRLFFMEARRGVFPVHVLHVFSEAGAEMRVRLFGVIPLVDAGGPDLTRAETVTFLNDMAVLAPGALLVSGVRWDPLDGGAARATYSIGSNTVGAVLHFNDDGRLADFVSGDRMAASPDGKSFVRQRWSTPLYGYKEFGPWRAAAGGEGRWHPDDGEAFSYIELELLDLSINGSSTGRRDRLARFGAVRRGDTEPPATRP